MNADIFVLKTGVAAGPATGGANPAWVSGNPASLALSASVICIFDLGPLWRQFPVVAIGVFPIGPSTGFSNLLVTSSDTAAEDLSRRPKGVAVSGLANLAAASVTTAALGVTEYVRPMGRYLTVALTNADGVSAMGATSAVTVAGYQA